MTLLAWHFSNFTIVLHIFDKKTLFVSKKLKNLILSLLLQEYQLIVGEGRFHCLKLPFCAPSPLGPPYGLGKGQIGH